MAQSPSTTITMKIDFTTAKVTRRPSDSADPSTAKPWIAAIKDTFLTDKYHLGLTINTAGAAGTCGVATIVGG